MLNRRFLRVKVLQALYALEQTEDSNPDIAKKNLDHNIQSIFDTYVRLLNVLPEIRFAALKKIDENKKKRLPSEEDLNPNLKFVDNPVLKLLSESKELRELSEKKKINWKGEENQHLVRTLFTALRKDPYYQDYMEGTFEESDAQFIRGVFKNFVLNTAVFQELFEEESIFWADDLDLAASMCIKTIKTIEENSKEDKSILLDLYKDREDEEGFYTTLFYKTINHSDEATKLIHNLSENWELDRIAQLDMLIMQMAISELIEFSSIPKKVTLNEYIELAKTYSTPKSGTFVNGILDKAIVELEKDGKVKKVGRGLVE